MNIRSYEDLVNGVRTWGTDRQQYDTVGVLHLLRAATENLCINKEDADFDPDSLFEIFSAEELSMLEEVINIARRS